MRAAGRPSLSPPALERLRRASLWAALAAVVLWVHLGEFSSILKWDSHIFMVIGQQIRRGLLPYRDLWELKPPGIFYYLAAVFTVLPEALWSVRLADMALYFAAAVCFYRVCRSEVSSPLAFLGTSIWLYLAHHETFNVGGVYTEEYGAVCTVFAMAAAVTYVRAGTARWAGLCGVAVALAALFKHPGFAVLLPAIIVMSRRPRFSGLVMLIIGVALPIGLVVAYFWSQGALDDFMTCNVWALATHGGLTRGVSQELAHQRILRLWRESISLFEPFPVVVGALAIGVPVCLLRPSRLRWAALIWVIIDYVGVAAQRNYFAHHYIFTFPSTCLLGTLALGWLVQPRAGERRLLTAIRVAVAVVLLWLALPSARAAYAARAEVVGAEWDVLLSGPHAWQKSPSGRFEEEVGSYIRERTLPQERVHVQGWGASLLGIYWAAERRVATRYFYEAPFPINTGRELEELRANRPEYVVVAGQPPYLYMGPWLASDYSLETVKWHDYPCALYVRTKERPFSDGIAAALSVTEAGNAMMLAATSAVDEAKGLEGESPDEPSGLRMPDGSVGASPSRDPRGPVHRRETPELVPEAVSKRRRAWWTSPTLKVQSDDDTVSVDWSPRNDVAANKTAHGFATVDAPSRDPDNDARVLLGQTTQRGRWSAWWRQETVPIVINFGLTAAVDHVTLDAAHPELGEEGCQPPDVAVSLTPLDPGSFVPVQGTWSVERPGRRTFRFAPRVAAAVRVLGPPTACDLAGGLTRIHVEAAGMGIKVRYRSGDQMDLSGVAWRDAADDVEVVKLPGGRFVQMQYELWSDHADVGPVLQYARIGRIRFEPDSVAAAAMSR